MTVRVDTASTPQNVQNLVKSSSAFGNSALRPVGKKLVTRPDFGHCQKHKGFLDLTEFFPGSNGT